MRTSIAVFRLRGKVSQQKRSEAAGGGDDCVPRSDASLAQQRRGAVDWQPGSSPSHKLRASLDGRGSDSTD